MNIKIYPSAEMQSVYSTAPADRAKGYTLGESYLSTEMQSAYSTRQADWAALPNKFQNDLFDLKKFI